MKDNNIMPEILENDLIKYKNTVWNVKRLSKELKKLLDIIDFWKGYEKINDDYINELYYDQHSFITDTIEDITAIYRKVGKDYICIWERN